MRPRDLRRAFDSVAPHAGDGCPRCGGPSPLARGSEILFGDRKVRTCPACARPVDERGKCLVRLWPDGRTYFRTITIMPSLPECPPLPEGVQEIQRLRREAEEKAQRSITTRNS